MSQFGQALFVKAANVLLTNPTLRKLIWRWSYDVFSNRARGSSWDFLNFGYVCDGLEGRPELDADDEANRLCIQLYHLISRFVDVRGRQVLEVGCGRGGGSAYIAKYLGPTLITGIDLSENAIRYCRQRHVGPNVSYQVGHAENVPFDDDRFDVVLNVESSHCYASVEKSFHEVARILKAGGTFFWADVNAARNDDKRLTNVGSIAVPSTLKLVHEEDITPKVVQAMDLMNDERERKLVGMFPGVLRQGALEDFGIKGSEFYRDMVAGRLVYLVRVYEKIPPRIFP